MSSQAILFLLTVVLGMFVGFIYDIFRVIRKSIKHKDLIIHIEDIIYWLIVSFIIFYFMLHMNNGEVRLFSIIGVFLGMILYFFTVSILVMKVSITIINIIKKVFIITFKLIVTPINIIFKIISVPLQFIRNIIRKVLRPVKSILQKIKSYVKIKVHKALKDLKVILKKV